MTEEKICMPYKVILKRFWGVSCYGQLKFKEAKQVVTMNLRFGVENWNDLYQEMKAKGFISCLGPRAGIQIEVPMKDLV